ncbi:nuclear-envelope, endoplasmic-reticulum-associated-degradation network protein NPL4, putative [Candida dubliniensis CD36]|uniref:Nuclear protein localization protein 4 n=1 Tax=Candida dubliniensis (strain CD36 / ATCC MYA-646 / CBS 7987 / NCPF 3949 / NRRL Y-17841) TaxID=573826 RepID=B9W822_CANDC|nr:nuclear-envelope, endoplasmic-reticulum-associated-degradation network protein NPL4, putative [Candida dubliniensis CD36]CAX44837.1 nuclear-envelope, endoplasmic-reticulum-associated-degradation network protein NPL4, putative [Candida dubliniensis CD36]
MTSIILRFRSKDGMFRISTDSSSNFTLVIEQLIEKLPQSDKINLQSLTISNKPQDKGKSVYEFQNHTINDLELKNGDILYISYESVTTDQPPTTTTTTTTNTSIPITPIVATSTSSHGPLKVEELPIDQELDKQDGLINRPLSSMCRHGPKGMCEYCSPLPPWDETYRKDHGIKHISFHAFLKQQLEKLKSSGGSYFPPLDPIDYSIDLTCNQGHKPYPNGICSKCQPSPITLQLQKFRMVDHLEFADSFILNDFINVWRISGVQRFGYLYGKYAKSDKTPLGIKAIVEMIIEPPQHDELDGITLLDWNKEEEEEKLVDNLANKFGLYKVGMIFTDLTDDGNKNGKVLCKRHKDSYFLTNLEIIMAAKFQLKYPNISKYSTTENNGQFSSKFVTCVISGGLNGEIEPRSYQVSTSAEALVKADIITGCTQPSQIYVNENNNHRYVPDIQYSKINEYGLEVKSNAKPTFPGEFLLVSLTDSFPLNPKPIFTNSYVIENREFLGDENNDIQSLKTLYNYLKSNNDQIFNFHFLLHLIKIHILNDMEIQLLIDYIKSKNLEDYLKLIETNGWMTLMTILEQSV